MKKLLLIITTLLIIILVFFISYKEESLELNINLNNSKDNLISSKFNKEYNISIKTNTNTKLAKEITELSKKTTYLLLGEYNESSEEYYKRHQNFKKLIYNPEVKDEKSEEATDKFIAEKSTEYMFNKLSELSIKYSSIGDVTVNESKNFIISKVVVPSITLKVESTDNPTKYDTKSSNLILKYYYKQYKKEYKLFYIESELKNDLYSTETSYAIKEENKSSLYNYKDINNINNSIYETNKSNIMKLYSYKLNEEVTSSIGVLLNKSVLLTTYSFIEKSLYESDYIVIKTISDRNVNIDGIISLNKEYNYALIKLKDIYPTTTQIGKTPNIEEGILEISNINGEIDLLKGIIVSNKNNIITSNDNYNDSILYDKNNNLISISINNEYINNDILKQLKEKTNKELKNIDSISFDNLKEEFSSQDTKYKEDNKVLPKTISKYEIVKVINDNISIPLVNYSKDNKTISLRYKNNINNYISSMSIFNSVKDNLKGYKNTYKSSNKEIYENNKYKIIAMEEFDYLIILVVIK